MSPLPTLAAGIDFGTSNSLAAVAVDGEVRVIAADPENTDPFVLPSLLYFSRYGWQSVGRAAVHGYQHDPDGQFVRALKSALPESDPSEVFRIMRAPYRLPDLIRFFLARLRDRLEGETGAAIRRATIGRPVRFSPDPQVDARAESMLREAAQLAGFEEVEFLSEPEAATRFYFHLAGRDVSERASVLVFDFGGGTLDLAIAQTGPNGYRILRTAGRHIGGTMLDRLLFEAKLLRHLGHGLKWGRGLDLPRAFFNRLINPDENWRITEAEYRHEVRRVLDASAAHGLAVMPFRTLHAVVAGRMGPDLFDAIEAAKVALSDSDVAEIRFDREGVHLRESLSREEMRSIFKEPLEAIRELILETLASAGMVPEDIDRVVLAGGSSALLCTQELLHDIFGPERVPQRQDLFTSIVGGLALHAAAGARVSA